MAQNPDGTVVLKEPGEVAQNPAGSGTGIVRPPAAKSSVSAPKVVRTKGRGPVSKNAR